MPTPTSQKATGPGQIEKLPDGSTLLFNFDIDSAVLKREHTAFLDQNVITAANANPGGLRVVLGGSADRLGDATHNVALSNRRIDAVANFLKQRLPRYPWDFKGFGEGVGEDNARRAGDQDGSADDLFRSVIVEVLKPGQPIPPKPRIPSNRPKKPNSFPRGVPRPIPSSCVTEQECPTGQRFSIQLLAGANGGEIIEAAFLTFLIKDLVNRVECIYSLTGGGLGTPGLPFNLVLIGKPSEFRTSKPAKVTDFGPVGGISSLTVPLNPALPPVTFFSSLDFTFRAPGGIIPSGNVFIGTFDTGPINIPGAGIHGGRFKAHGFCRGGPGADKF